MKKSAQKQQKAKSRQEKLRRQKAKQSSQPRLLRHHPELDEALSPHHPLHACLINKGWKEAGMASIHLYRQTPIGLVAVDFLIDLLGFGLKDIGGNYALDKNDVKDVPEKSQIALVPCDPDLAANLVYGGVAWAKRYNFKLPKDYHLWLRLLPPPPEIDLSPFGRDGKPLLILNDDTDMDRRIFEEDVFDPQILLDGLTIGNDGPSRTLLERIGNIKRALIDFSRSDAFADAENKAWNIFRRKPTKLSHRDEKILFRDWFTLEYDLEDGYRIVEHFLDHYAHIMSDDVTDMLEDWLDVIDGLFEVKTVKGDGYALYNLVNEVHYTVYPTLFENISEIQPGAFLLARILPVRNTFHVFSGGISVLPWDGSDRGKAEIYRMAIMFQTRNPLEAFRDNEEKLRRSIKRASENHQDFVAFFGSDEVMGTGMAIAEKYRDFQAHIFLHRKDPKTGNSKAEKYEKLFGKTYEIPKFNLPDMFLNCRDAVMIHDPIEGVSFLEEYGDFKDIFSNPLRNLAGRKTKELFFGYLESDTINDRPFRLAAAASPEGFRRVLDYYEVWKDFTPDQMDDFLWRYKPWTFEKYPTTVVLLDDEMARLYATYI